jgi:hypothetical protein
VSGRAYGRFATTAGEAAAGLRGLDSGAWVGSEGDLFRARVAELPRPGAGGRPRGRADDPRRGRTSPTADQNWLQDRWEKTSAGCRAGADDLKAFVAEHAEAVRLMAKALRVVGIALVAVGAVLAVLGVGTAVMGASDALSSTVDWAEGKISGSQLLFRAGVAIGFSAAGGVAGKAVGKGLERLAPKLGRWMDTAEAARNAQRLADSREALTHPDGRIIPNPGPKDFGPAPPQPPTSSDGLGREGAMVGAAADPAPLRAAARGGQRWADRGSARRRSAGPAGRRAGRAALGCRHRP